MRSIGIIYMLIAAGCLVGLRWRATFDWTRQRVLDYHHNRPQRTKTHRQH